MSLFGTILVIGTFAGVASAQAPDSVRADSVGGLSEHVRHGGDHG